MGIFGRKQNALTLEVPGMHCGHCEQRVKVILESVPGVASVKPSAEKGNVVVGLDSGSPADEQTIRAELEAGGYPAS
ncbi:MAG: heavy-metal-associated domain-containing protein [bacterium]